MSIPQTQQAVVISAAGGPDVLQISSQPMPMPGPGQILIKVAAAGVNRHDCNQRTTGPAYGGSPIPGLEVSGQIIAADDLATQARIGETVCALVQGGGYAEYVVADSALALPAPDGLDLIEAAAIPEALFTAWYNFFTLMKLEKEEFALIHGGTSGVGHLALQAMSALGYRVIATSGSDEKVAAAKVFGAFAAFSYKDPELVQKVKDATQGQGVGALLDMSAGAHLTSDLDMMAPGGRIAHLSGGGGKSLTLPLRQVMAKQLWVTGSLLRPLAQAKKALIADQLRRDVWPLLGRSVRPAIAHEFPLAKAAESHREMEKNGHIGKIMLNVAG
jgi:NADPH2:quinone reductase